MEIVFCGGVVTPQYIQKVTHFLLCFMWKSTNVEHTAVKVFNMSTEVLTKDWTDTVRIWCGFCCFILITSSLFFFDFGTTWSLEPALPAASSTAHTPRQSPPLLYKGRESLVPSETPVPTAVPTPSHELTAAGQRPATVLLTWTFLPDVGNNTSNPDMQRNQTIDGP